ncbi:N-carbamoyl-L-amino acid amidohydrolase [Salipiger aestuarii]|uniref:N-carbamoyl-L-amino-acid hydrolase n=1 Tax=Salipiger aestuarii TaxID=568098 RepID=A0A327YHP0_9RHOB|nr:allantoate amidohydrolase [Salipiger aestuarii]EIE51458.1 allantoate amidohydrolase [Citreicella sp. 357]KAA8606153.1 N-carbamoyl-L-amino acid amidohydrolase [Salipiger aestuarii]KAA8608920.1 N-carbamoyl-L-amino acid amidohydrolase [Salipiger aestuarii]KAB2543023.1 N-carbamoyl-L-amino acid amidohydrolase [Salipiger aestuarii]RAK19716.1 N-carbamoyl-L-amino-acid hydrolase [Salipiger aestuarii]
MPDRIPDDLIALIDRFARIGATPGGGVRRLTGSAEDGAARALFADLAQARGARVAVDPVGNMFATFLTAPDATTTVLCGSHLDSQPTGGRFDGALGVLAALDGAAALFAQGIDAEHNLTVVNWTNEEGARFQPSLTGSSVFCGKYSADFALGLTDRAGVTMGDALGQIGWLGTGTPGLTPVHHLELHVEQGSVLEDSGVQIGAVTASWGVRKLTLAFTGAPSHTGPTAMHKRRDALRAAALAITRFHDRMQGETAQLHWSAARIVAEPDSPNVVAARVTVWFEIRNPDQQICTEVGDRFLRAIAADIDALGCGIEVVTDEARPGTALDPAGVRLTLEVCETLGLRATEMRTITGHDALALAAVMPSTLVFVPSVGGLSHCEDELTLPDDLRNGGAVIRETLRRLACPAEDAARARTDSG